MVGTLLADLDEWFVRPHHFSERHGLILIVANHEVIVALGAPLTRGLEEGGGPESATLAVAGALAARLFWGYFDRLGPALERCHEALDGGRNTGSFARDVYTYAHRLLVAGVVIASAGLEEITFHPEQPVPVA